MAGYFAAKQPLETPYAPANARWDTQVGAPTVAAYHWRLFAFALVAAVVLAVAGLIYSARNAHVVPVYIGIDALGQARVLANVQTETQPSDASIAFHLRQFVIHVWRVTGDPAVTKQGWIEAYHFATAGRGHAALGAELGEWLDRPAELLARKGLMRVVPEQPLKVSDNSWQVDWVLTHVDINGKPGRSVKMRGTFTLARIKPKTTQDVVRNPLGVYVDDFHKIEL
jgi:type IV secretion system protein VirB5